MMIASKKISIMWFKKDLRLYDNEALSLAAANGFTVGLFETMGSYYISGSHKDAFAFILMIIVLLIKPTGFFGVSVKMKA